MDYFPSEMIALYVIYQRNLQVLNRVDVVDRYIDKIGVITRMSPCPAGVGISVDVVDSFIRPKMILAKWWRECHHVLQMLNTANVVDRFIRPKIILAMWWPECHHVLQMLNTADVVDRFVRLKIKSARWLSEYLIVADTSAPRSGLQQVANGEQGTHEREL